MREREREREREEEEEEILKNSRKEEESLIIPPTTIVEKKSLYRDYNTLNSSFHLKHDANSFFQKFENYHSALSLHCIKQ